MPWRAAIAGLIALAAAGCIVTDEIEFQGDVNYPPEVLGTQHFADGRKRCPAPKRLTEILARLTRIKTCGAHIWQKAAAVRSMVLPIATYTGAWTRPTKQLIDRLRRAVELAVLGDTPNCRSRCLLGGQTRARSRP